MTDQSFLIWHSTELARLVDADVYQVRGGLPRGATRNALAARHATMRVALAWGIPRKRIAGFFGVSHQQLARQRRVPKNMGRLIIQSEIKTLAQDARLRGAASEST